MGILSRLFRPKIERLKHDRDVDGLAEILSAEVDLEQRLQAIEALVEVGGDVAGPIVAVLDDADPKVVRAAEGALRSLGVNASEALVAGLSGDAGDRALALVLALGADAEPVLSTAAVSDQEDVRRRSLEGLSALARTSPDDEVRDSACRSLVKMLGDRSPQCRTAAAEALSGLKDPRAAKALAAQLKDGEASVRDACRKALADIGPAAAPSITSALVERNANSRLLAAGLLGEVCTETVALADRRVALLDLMNLRDDADSAIAAAAADALTRIPGDDVLTAAIDRLIELEGDERHEVAAFANNLLEHGRIGDDSRREALGRLATIPGVGDLDVT